MKFSKIETADKLTTAFDKVNNNFSLILESVSLEELNNAIDKLPTKNDFGVLNKSLNDKIEQLEQENNSLRQELSNLTNLINDLDKKINNSVSISQFNSQIANINSIITK